MTVFAYTLAISQIILQKLTNSLIPDCFVHFANYSLPYLNVIIGSSDLYLSILFYFLYFFIIGIGYGFGFGIWDLDTKK